MVQNELRIFANLKLNKKFELSRFAGNRLIALEFLNFKEFIFANALSKTLHFCQTLKDEFTHEGLIRNVHF